MFSGRLHIRELLLRVYDHLLYTQSIHESDAFLIDPALEEEYTADTVSDFGNV